MPHVVKPLIPKHFCDFLHANYNRLTSQDDLTLPIYSVCNIQYYSSTWVPIVVVKDVVRNFIVSDTVQASVCAT